MRKMTFHHKVQSYHITFIMLVYVLIKNIIKLFSQKLILKQFLIFNETVYLNRLRTIAVMCVQFSCFAINSQPFPGHTTDNYDIAIRRESDTLCLFLNKA